ncbi:hypothetical protein DFP72DRAFT_853142 [Ephemerocybe angulata]|uniref:C2H2-type domain-containing protein n=1 Tax=Ephemerocybe angulata TaxID=980116 RepID=A0A8H6HN56_9AGAR|nr:hypothetical protein DFP72DRAFT_853142 [Tulosesus angulatus]
MQFSLLAFLPVFISLASIVNAHHDHGLHARDEVSATRSFDESQLSLRELLGEMTTRELIEEFTERLERRNVFTCPCCKATFTEAQTEQACGRRHGEEALHSLLEVYFQCKASMDIGAYEFSCAVGFRRASSSNIPESQVRRTYGGKDVRKAVYESHKEAE